MQDRFKYKAIDVETKEVIYIENLYWFEENGILCVDDDGIARGHIGNYYILQCTGKKDCTGVLIYENDFVTVTGRNGAKFCYIVKYDNSEYRWVLIDNCTHLRGEKSRDFSKQYAEKKVLYKEGFRIIGNVFTNPELLEYKL